MNKLRKLLDSTQNQTRTFTKVPTLNPHHLTGGQHSDWA